MSESAHVSVCAVLEEESSAPAIVHPHAGAGFSVPAPFLTDGQTFFIPMQLARRCGRRVSVTYRDGTAGSEPDKAQPPPELNPMVNALASAFHWQAMIDDGRYDDHSAVGNALKIERTAIARLSRLVFLAPDIVDAILNGREPSGMSLTKLTDANLPDEWDAQRRILGFPPYA